MATSLTASCLGSSKPNPASSKWKPLNLNDQWEISLRAWRPLFCLSYFLLPTLDSSWSWPTGTLWHFCLWPQCACCPSQSRCSCWHSEKWENTDGPAHAYKAANTRENTKFLEPWGAPRWRGVAWTGLTPANLLWSPGTFLPLLNVEHLWAELPAPQLALRDHIYFAQ